MPHIDIERLVLNYSYHLVFCAVFILRAALSAYRSRVTLQSVLKFKTNLVSSLRYYLKNKS